MSRPVISVGALAVGGSGKTPLTAHLARTLVGMGERPAVLSRGYGRADPVDGVVVVRDTASRGHDEEQGFATLVGGTLTASEAFPMDRYRRLHPTNSAACNLN